jgi:ElaB/YqjD/DUF883 family membrane-anchored ribosome-binding protein
MENDDIFTDEMSTEDRDQADDHLTSIREILAKGLGPEGQENLEQFGAKLNEIVEEARIYFRDNPREALAVGAAAGLAAWALLATKPGRRVLEIGTVTFLPKIRDWVTKTFSAPKATSIH